MDDTIWMMAATAIAIIGIAAALGVVTLARRRSRKADRLDHAFERAKYARRTGTMGSDRGYIR